MKYFGLQTFGQNMDPTVFRSRIVSRFQTCFKVVVDLVLWSFSPTLFDPSHIRDPSETSAATI